VASPVTGFTSQVSVMAKPLNVKIGIIVSAIGIILAGASIFLYVLDGWCGIEPSKTEKAVQLVILCIWIVSPPLWFAVEPLLTKEKKLTEELRQGQEIVARIWLGVSAMLGLLASALLKCPH